MKRHLKYTLIIFSILALSSFAFGQDNVVLNGDFSDGLNNWDFEDASTFYPACVDAGKVAYAEAENINGMGRIHGYSAYGTGWLWQDFPEISPTTLKYYYRIGSDPAGYVAGSGRATLHLYHDDVEIFSFSATNDSSSYDKTGVCFMGDCHLIVPDGTSITEANVEVQFNYSDEKVYVLVDDTLEFTYDIPAGTQVLANKIGLRGSLSACDGRDNCYAYFDDIVLFAEDSSQTAKESLENIINQLNSLGGYEDIIIDYLDPVMSCIIDDNFLFPGCGKDALKKVKVATKLISIQEIQESLVEVTKMLANSLIEEISGLSLKNYKAIEHLASAVSYFTEADIQENPKNKIQYYRKSWGKAWKAFQAESKEFRKATAKVAAKHFAKYLSSDYWSEISKRKAEKNMQDMAVSTEETLAGVFIQSAIALSSSTASSAYAMVEYLDLASQGLSSIQLSPVSLILFNSEIECGFKIEDKFIELSEQIKNKGFVEASLISDIDSAIDCYITEINAYQDSYDFWFDIKAFNFTKRILYSSSNFIETLTWIDLLIW